MAELDAHYAAVTAALLREFPDGSVDYGRLQREVSYALPARHAVAGRLALVHVECDRDGEDGTHFADGNSDSAVCRVRGTTHWLVGETRVCLTCRWKHHYDIESHCGGVDSISGDPSPPQAVPAGVVLTAREHALMRTAAVLSAASIHKSGFPRKTKWIALPSVILDKLLNELGLEEEDDYESSWEFLRADYEGGWETRDDEPGENALDVSDAHCAVTPSAADAFATWAAKFTAAHAFAAWADSCARAIKRANSKTTAPWAVHESALQKKSGLSLS